MPAGRAVTTGGNPHGRAPHAPGGASADDDSATTPPAAGPSGSNQAQGQSSGKGQAQRSAKACDRCRKSKSKCEPSPIEGVPCKACAAISAECTYTAPSFRRGPPKGYIQALEHRLHQVESVLAAIMTSTDVRSQSIVDELSKDELAGYILDTVDAGPFGRTGREKRSIDTTKDNFFSSLVTEKPKAQSHRSRRESRATRENVIENVIARDPQVQTTRPTLLWQDRLSERLARSFGSRSMSPQDQTSLSRAHSSSSNVADKSVTEPPRTKRRLDGPSPDAVQLRPPYISRQQEAPALADERDDDDLADCADAFGNLSIDENREVRYHGNSCGLQLLARADRTDGRNIKGIWNFPMAKFWPGPGAQLEVDHDWARVERNIQIPPAHVMDRLVQAYFTYINPAVPVVDEASFMEQYEAMKLSYSDPDHSEPAPANSEVRPQQPQKLSKLLLFAMFAYAASHLDPLDRAGARGGERPRAYAEEYAACARRILDTMYHESRSSTVQALILLGMREFGIGSLEEGWLHIGMAVRMALDLGLNRNPDKWMHNGRELFTEREKEIRKRIWWACCLADKFSAIFLGRTIAIHEGDFSTPLLETPENDLEQMWQPCPFDPKYGTITPVPGAYLGYVRHISSLYVITGEVLANVYRVSRAYTVPSRALRQQLYTRLLQWAVELPEHLNYAVQSTRPCPAPHILVMHVQYWATVLLLHRPFIPKGAELARAGSPSLDPDPVPWESYDICQSAASQIASFAMLYHETYDMRWAPPLLATLLQAAGIMHIVTLKYKPLDTQASVGLQKCINALSGMEVTWASGLRVRHLIQNAKVNIDRAYASSNGPDPRQKRPAEVAFEYDTGHDARYPPRADAAPAQAASAPAPSSYVPTAALPPYHPPQSHVVPSQATPYPPAPPRRVHPHPQSHPHSYSHSHQGYRYPSHTGLQHDVPTLAGYTPGYDSWWSVPEHQPAETVVPGVATGVPPVPVSLAGAAPAAVGEGLDAATGGGTAGAPPQGPGLPSQDFTFNQQYFSPEFLQAMRDPVIHFPSLFAHPY